MSPPWNVWNQGLHTKFIVNRFKESGIQELLNVSVPVFPWFPGTPGIFPMIGLTPVLILIFANYKFDQICKYVKSIKKPKYSPKCSPTNKFQDIKTLPLHLFSTFYDRRRRTSVFDGTMKPTPYYTITLFI